MSAGDFTQPTKVAAIILGASEFPNVPKDKELDNLAFARSARAFRELLEQDGMMKPGKPVVLDLFDSELDPQGHLKQIANFLDKESDATDIILYFCGHGGLLSEDRLNLILHNFDEEYDQTSGLQLSTARRHIDKLSRKRMFVILDCCFAGSALRDLQASAIAPIMQNESVLRSGVVLVAAASRRRTARSLAGESLTMFTDALVSTLRDGIPSESRMLSIRDVVGAMQRKLLDRKVDGAVIPEIHAPRQNGGDPSLTDLFCNHAYDATRTTAPEKSQFEASVQALGSELKLPRAAAILSLEQLLRNTSSNDLKEKIIALVKTTQFSDDSMHVRTTCGEVLDRRRRNGNEDQKDCSPPKALAETLDKVTLLALTEQQTAALERESCHDKAIERTLKPDDQQDADRMQFSLALVDMGSVIPQTRVSALEKMGELIKQTRSVELKHAILREIKSHYADDSILVVKRSKDVAHEHRSIPGASDWLKWLAAAVIVIFGTQATIEFVQSRYPHISVDSLFLCHLAAFGCLSDDEIKQAIQNTSSLAELAKLRSSYPRFASDVDRRTASIDADLQRARDEIMKANSRSILKKLLSQYPTLAHLVSERIAQLEMEEAPLRVVIPNQIDRMALVRIADAHPDLASLAKERIDKLDADAKIRDRVVQTIGGERDKKVLLLLKSKYPDLSRLIDSRISQVETDDENQLAIINALTDVQVLGNIRQTHPWLAKEIDDRVKFLADSATKLQGGAAIGYVPVAEIDRNDRVKSFFNIEATKTSYFAGLDTVVVCRCDSGRVFSVRPFPYRLDTKSFSFVKGGEAVVAVTRGQKLKVAGDTILTYDPTAKVYYALALVSQAFDGEYKPPSSVFNFFDFDPSILGYVNIGTLDAGGGQFKRKYFANKTRANALYPVAGDDLIVDRTLSLRGGPRHWDSEGKHEVEFDEIKRVTKDQKVEVARGNLFVSGHDMSVWAPVSKVSNCIFSSSLCMGVD